MLRQVARKAAQFLGEREQAKQQRIFQLTRKSSAS